MYADFWIVSVYRFEIFDVKLLLVHGCRCQKCGFYATLEPFRSMFAGIAYIVDALAFMLYALSLAEANGDVACYFFVVFQFVCSCYFSVTYTGPACVESELLCE